MAYVDPSTVAAGDVATAAWADIMVNDVTFLHGPPACRLYNSTTQAIASGAVHTISFDTERFDTDGMHVSGSPTHITFNTAGKYLVGATISMHSSAATLINPTIRLNATSFIASAQIAPIASQNTEIAIGTIYQFAAADFIELGVFHNAGVNVNSDNFTDYAPCLWALWVSA